ncbi:MAG: hypothetical protein LBR77_07225 [Lachnospiraceae bacterium]|jgi:hypothetical protein|nr:hypothetical protein [Lachnospiraceae bacterium]
MENVAAISKSPPVEYEAQVASPLGSGKGAMVIGGAGLRVSLLFDTVEIPFAQMNALVMADYAVTVRSDSGDFTFSRMGSWCEPFYGALCDAYNEAVRRSLFLTGDVLLQAVGEYRYEESPGADGGVGAGTGYSAGGPYGNGGKAPVLVYENCVAVLPPDLGARRIPLCFANGMDKGNYALTLSVGGGGRIPGVAPNGRNGADGLWPPAGADAGAAPLAKGAAGGAGGPSGRYTFAKLGYDTDPFADILEKQIRRLREKAAATAREIDPGLTPMQASRIGALIPEGAAAPIGELAAIAPGFAAALEEKIGTTRAAESFEVFKRLCVPGQIYVGFKKNEGAWGLLAAIGAGFPEAGTAGGGGPGAMSDGGVSGGGPMAVQTAGMAAGPDPYLIWLVAPSPDFRYAAVEFAAADSATFVYGTGGDFHGFAAQLNRALEAIAFRREVIRLTDEELRKPENADYYMASKRTAALQFVRAHFAGRVIHSTPAAWERKLLEMWGMGA